MTILVRLQIFYRWYSGQSHPITFRNHMWTKFATRALLYAIYNFKIYDIFSTYT